MLNESVRLSASPTTSNPAMIVGLAMPAAPKPMIRPILVTIAAVAPKLTMVGLNPIIGLAPWALKLRVCTYPGLAAGDSSAKYGSSADRGRELLSYGCATILDLCQHHCPRIVELWSCCRTVRPPPIRVMHNCID